VDEQAKDRVVKNETLFRDINERVKQIDQAHGIPTDELWDFLCECGRTDCLERISMTVTEYELVRANAVQFAIVPGHEVGEVERVVDEKQRFAVVEKRPDEQRLALETDPRA
jgi:hypothetical protein